MINNKLIYSTLWTTPDHSYFASILQPLCGLMSVLIVVERTEDIGGLAPAPTTTKHYLLICHYAVPIIVGIQLGSATISMVTHVSDV